MTILIISTLFPPEVLGGADVAAYDLAKWLVSKGHEVHVLASSRSRQSEELGTNREGIKVWRLWTRRRYSAYDSARAGLVGKMVWHIRDHIDPDNIYRFRRLLKIVHPDIININTIQGLGYNTIWEIARKDIPLVFTTHDLGLICIKMSMFVNSQNCGRRHAFCQLCKLSAFAKWRVLSKVRRLSFWSPSHATISRLSHFSNIALFPTRAIKLPVTFSPPKRPRIASSEPRFLYVGRLHDSKGIGFLLSIFAKLRKCRPFTVTIAGTGQSEFYLKTAFPDERWCRFLGHRPASEIGDLMMAADALCVPSLWFETAGIVIYQARSLGLPVIASRIGGIPELISDGKNGLLIEPGNERAWMQTFMDLLSDPTILERLRVGSGLARSDFDQDKVGNQVMNLFNETIIGAQA